MGKIIAEKKECKICRRVKMIPTFAEVCGPCKVDSHDKINYVLQNICLGRPYNYRRQVVNAG